MPALYEPICDRCNSDSIITLATEERFGIPLCAACAKADDEREPPDPDLNDGGAAEQIARGYDLMRERRRW